MRPRRHPAGCDFFHVDLANLRRVYVFFILDVRNRYIHILGTTTNPTGAWTTQLAQNLAADLGQHASQPRHLIRDRDAKYTAAFDAVFASEGIQPLLAPAQCPRANAYAERFVLTARRECTDRMLLLGERHLRVALDEFADHYNRGRPHRSLDRRAPTDNPNVAPLPVQLDQIRQRKVLGDLISEYEQAA